MKDKLENKQEICNALCSALKLTREYCNLDELVYVYDKDINVNPFLNEYVYIKYENGGVARAFVTGDSGSAMVGDILKNLHNHIISRNDAIYMKNVYKETCLDELLEENKVEESLSLDATEWEREVLGEIER